MATLNIGYSFNQVGTNSPNFVRDYFETIEDMKNFPESSLPGVFITSVKETGRVYKFIKSAIPNSEFGKWKEISNQYSVLPVASEANLNEVLQYTGETNVDFTKGVFYHVKKEDSGKKESATMYAWTFNGETYFTTKEIFGNEERVDLFTKQENNFVKVEEHFGVYYIGDGIYFDDGEELIERAEGSDETIETPIFNYSWEALSSSGGIVESETEQIDFSTWDGYVPYVSEITGTTIEGEALIVGDDSNITIDPNDIEDNY